MCMFEITSDARIWFQMAPGQPCRWMSGTNNWVRAHVGDVIIVWRNTHNNAEPNAFWLPATLTDTDLNIQGILVKYRTNWKCNIPATESRLWGTKWYFLFSAHVRMLRRGAFRIFHTTIFNWTFFKGLLLHHLSYDFWWLLGQMQTGESLYGTPNSSSSYFIPNIIQKMKDRIHE